MHVEFLVHHVENEVGKEGDAEQDAREQQGRRHLPTLGNHRAEEHSGERAYATQCDLCAHRQSHLVAREPFGNDLADGDATHLIAHRKDSKADAGNDDLTVMSKKHKMAGVGHRAGHILDGDVLDERSDNHQRAGDGTREAGAHLVEDDASEDEHQAEYVKPAVRRIEEAVVTCRPAVLALQGRHQRRHSVVKEIAEQHRQRDDEQYCPPDRRFTI